MGVPELRLRVRARSHRGSAALRGAAASARLPAAGPPLPQVPPGDPVHVACYPCISSGCFALVSIISPAAAKHGKAGTFREKEANCASASFNLCAYSWESPRGHALMGALQGTVQLQWNA